MKKNYTHLSAEERAVIMIEHGKGSSMRAIAACSDAARRRSPGNWLATETR
jgi:hypothetical protein